MYLPAPLFFFVTFFVGLLGQAMFLYVVPPGWPTPQWLMLAVLAVGVRGWTKWAMTLGFFWGLCLDVMGLTTFGIQGWLLTCVGAGAGMVAKHVDSEKWGTQEVLALGAGVVLEMGLWVLTHFFPASSGGHLTWGRAMVRVVLNGLAAPAVFWIVTVWAMLWDQRAGERNDQ